MVSAVIRLKKGCSMYQESQSRCPFEQLQERQAPMRLVGVVSPPLAFGMMWSRVAWRPSWVPQYAQQLFVRLRMVSRQRRRASRLRISSLPSMCSSTGSLLWFSLVGWEVEVGATHVEECFAGHPVKLGGIERCLVV